MASYIVITDPTDRTGANVRFVRDGFSFIAFVAPLIWLLWKRLWLEAALLFALVGVCAFAADFALGGRSAEMMPLVWLASGLLCALEGPARLVANLERRGMKVLQVIVAPRRRVAEEIFASRHDFAMPVQSAPQRAFQPVSSHSLIPLTGAL